MGGASCRLLAVKSSVNMGSFGSLRFSGDTQPTNTLVWAGQGATLLIHEATMADDQAEMAKRKAHSTFGQAIDIGRRSVVPWPTLQWTVD